MIRRTDGVQNCGTCWHLTCPSVMHCGECGALEGFPNWQSDRATEKKHLIHIGDIVTSRCQGTQDGKNFDCRERIFKVIGQMRIGELDELGGLWKLKDFVNGEELEIVGNYITVWKPVEDILKRGNCGKFDS